jgi:hypothetical protein
VRPPRNSSPLPLLDHFRVGLSEETSDASERLAPPITQLLDSRINELRGEIALFASFGPLFVFFMVCCCLLDVVNLSRVV